MSSSNSASTAPSVLGPEGPDACNPSGRVAGQSPRLRLVGGACWQSPDGAAGILDRKTAAALLLAASGAGGSRERVASLLWPRSPEATARGNLRVLLHRLHASCDRSVVQSSAGWKLEPDIATDLDIMDVHLLAAPLLDGLSYTDLDELQAEIKTCQDALWQRCAAHLIADAETALQTGLTFQVVAAMRAVLKVFPTDEAACRLLMRAQAAQGQTPAALASYEQLRARLSDDLGVSPDPQTRQLQLELLHRSSASRPHGPDSPDAALALNALRVVGRADTVENISKLGYEMRHVWLEGETGVGKSRVVDELMQRTQAVRVRCRSAECKQQFGVLTRLVGARSGDCGIGMLNPLGMFERTLRTLQQMRRDGVIQVVVEDVHYIDEYSARLFVELIDCMFDDAQLMLDLPSLVFTARSRPHPAAAGMLHAVALESPAFESIVLRGLTRPQARALVAALATVPGYGWADTDHCADRLYRKSGGNPLFIIQLVRAAQGMQEPAALDVRVRSVEELLAQRLAVASRDANDLACLVAVAQSDFDPRMPHELLGQDGPRMVLAWRELVCLGLFHEQGFSHELACAAVMGPMVAPQRQLLHAAIAEFLERHGCDAQRVQHHRHSSHRQASPVVRQELDASLAAVGPVGVLTGLGELHGCPIPAPARSPLQDTALHLGAPGCHWVSTSKN
jgi:DNA-binding SARP family transcriptional activator